MLKSRTRKRIGFLLHEAASRIFRMVASHAEMVPKKRNPCSLMTRVCRPTSLRKALCLGCLRTVERATAPVRMERMARRWEEETTKLTQARMIPAPMPATKSQPVMTMTMAQMVTYSNRATRPWVSQIACEGKLASGQRAALSRLDAVRKRAHLLDQVDGEDEDERSNDADGQ